jgi:membrane-bound lytic murein transglycosylase B
MSRSGSTARFGRGQKAMALVPLAVLSAAWTASIATTGAGTALADADPEQALPDGTSLPGQAIEAPASVSSAGGVATGEVGNAKQVVATASAAGIPAAALAAYQRAETVINSADPGCHLSWQLVAAIGRVESNHGRTGGNSLDAQGVAEPGIFGAPLTGKGGTSRISDTDAGQFDSDSTWDRAVGPMQFIPSTWSVVGVDADGDGKRNPQDVDDAALATAVYLCSGDDNLGTTAGQRAAVLRYNHSPSYVDLVLSIMNAYLHGDFTSVPNGTTSAGYLVPAQHSSSAHGPAGHHQHGQPHGDQTGGSGPGSTSGQSGTEPSQGPSAPPTSDTGGDGGSGGGGDGGGGGGGGLPASSVPPLPSTSVTPVDHLLTHAQAVVQCGLDGYVDNILRDDDPFDQCVYDYTH